MPIRESQKARYPADWPAISQRIRAREGQRCKWCKAPNGKWVVRLSDSHLWSQVAHEGQYPGKLDVIWWGEDGPVLERDVPRHAKVIGPVKVVLTVAHLDHQPENCADDNLAALCQRCHNRYDLPSRRAGRKARLGVLDLLPPERAS